MNRWLKKSIFILLLSACSKDKAILPCPEEPLTVSQPKISFIFVNRNGFRNDSTGNFVNDTVLGAVCLESKYYNPNSNISQISSTCYNRNFPSNNFPLSDSIVHREYPIFVGSAFALEVELIWKDKNLFTTKGFKYATINWPSGEYITNAEDTVIKFVWPDDTMPGSRFHKTFQYP
jgi:hypothetical protein